MEIFSDFKIVQSILVLLAAFLIRQIIKKSLRKIRLKFGFSKARIMMMNKVLSVIFYSTALVIVAFIWGVDKHELFLFITSFLTILGIAFFAQWSILSNITAGIILFVNYPVKIGDRIKIVEKDNNVEGEIADINAFFITLKISDTERMMIPNSVILQKQISYTINN